MPFCVKFMLYIKKVSIGKRRYKVGSGSRGTAEVGDLHALNSLAQLTFGPVNTFFIIQHKTRNGDAFIMKLK